MTTLSCYHHGGASEADPFAHRLSSITMLGTNRIRIIGMVSVCACDDQRRSGSGGYGTTGDGTAGNSFEIEFAADVASNVDAPENVDELNFVDRFGNPVNISDYVGKKNLLVTVTRGFTQPLCPFCQVQTSRLISTDLELSRF